MTHVFVVNEITFNTHLQYLFAGTGNAEYEPNFNAENKEKYPAEKVLTAMIADISRVRSGDKVLFYVTGCKKFFGIFKIDGCPFFESKTSNKLHEFLGEKYLPFRVKIKPLTVYAKGISEQSALDDISTLDKPYNMCWSMIYRKLTGMRGCSFVTDYEMERIEQLLDEKNQSQSLLGVDFAYDKDQGEIICSSTHKQYDGATTDLLTIDKRLYCVGKHEVHLQAYITQNFDKNPLLKTKLFTANPLKIWIGNEVICSVGEKRIDLLTIAETQDQTKIRVIELKDQRPTAEILQKQLPWYLKWVQQYVAPNIKGKPIKIIPTIIAHPYARNTKRKREFEREMVLFNDANHLVSNTNATIENLECIYYDRSAFPIKIY